MKPNWKLFIFTGLLCIPVMSVMAVKPVKRLALVAGANDGGRDRVTLKYAVRDAQEFAAVLQKMGGVEPGDRFLLADPDSNTFIKAGEKLAQKAREARAKGHRVEAILYYSGHADETGLLIGEQKIPYSVFRTMTDSMPAEIRIGIVDACASGALTRLKGGRHRPAFLLDESSDMQGHAFLTSSSESEAAQESDRIKGSYFTHSLNTGLRGAADFSNDGKVTLDEAYRFAYHETLARTEKSLSGPQHAGYDIRMAGTGEVVMTDLRGSSATLKLTEELSGRFFIRNLQGHLIAELHKPAGRNIELGLEPGEYSIRNHSSRSEGVADASVTIMQNRSATLNPGDFQSTDLEATTSRGTAPGETQPQHVPVNFSIMPGSDLIGQSGKGFKHSTSINLVMGEAAEINGWQISLLANQVWGPVDGFQLSGLNFTQGKVDGFQLGYVINWTRDEMDGFQIGGANYIEGQADAIQLGYGFNLAREDLKGVQITSGINNVEGEASALQIASAINRVGKTMHGPQISGLANLVHGDMNWGQISGVVNIGLQKSRGVQFAGFGNISHKMSGVQIAPVNVVQSLQGIQLGVVNVSDKITGLQGGVINVSREMKGIGIGLFNYSHNGIFQSNAWTNETGFLQAGISSGTRSMYTNLTLLSGDWAGERAYGGGFGLGSLFDIHQMLFLGFEANQFHLQKDFSQFRKAEWTQIRAFLGFAPFHWLTVYGGPSYNFFLTETGQSSLVDKNYNGNRELDDFLYAWPGFSIGFKIGKRGLF